MHVELSLLKALISSCPSLWVQTCRVMPLFLSHSSTPAFSTAAFLQQGGLAELAARAWEPGYLQVLLAKAGELRSCLCITWYIGKHENQTTCPCGNQTHGDTIWMKCCITKKCKLFCVCVLGWRFLCNAEANIPAFFVLTGKSLQSFNFFCTSVLSL